MVALKSQFETYGTKWIWILAWDGGTPEPTTALSQSFYEDLGVDFGWFTDDQDNSLGFCAYLNSDINGGGVPWWGIIDATTMEIVASRPTNTGSLVQSLGTD
ncbi:MAG: hypothetical protein JRG91_03600 [Deltaproteobacteria bacterium]|nr:hypothetical protein [Deltaproteobacteria bacterium]